MPAENLQGRISWGGGGWKYSLAFVIALGKQMEASEVLRIDKKEEGWNISLSRNKGGRS